MPGAVLVGAAVVEAEEVAGAQIQVGAQIQAAVAVQKARRLVMGPLVFVQEHPEPVYYTFDKGNFLKTRLQFHLSESKTSKKILHLLTKVERISENRGSDFS